MDTFFISHGAVTLVSDETAPPWLFMKSWKSDIMQEAPKAILIISGHWDTDAPTVNLFHGAIDTIHDFTGVPEFFYKVLLGCFISRLCQH
jgi:4,5-DOPA dioxygenase extradiol